jgi:hypothetical protein
MNPAKLKIAIVSTVKEFTHNHIFFINHHFSKGVKHFYFFLDDASKISTNLIIETACKAVGASYVIQVKDDDLIKTWSQIPGHAALWAELDSLVVNRQALNVWIAEKHAIVDGIDWLIHIDDDEILWPQGFDDLSAYFNQIPDEITNVTMLNMEALYEKDNYEFRFEGITNFKKNPYTLAPAQVQFLTDGLNKKYFYVSYAHGKSAIRISSLNGVPKLPSGVHRFEVENRIYFEANHLDLVVLHFPFSGLDEFVGKFTGANSKRLYQYEKLADQVNFYTEARKLFFNQNVDAVSLFYKNNVIYAPQEIEVMKKAKLIFTISQ